jgi:hypothetical protein
MPISNENVEKKIVKEGKWEDVIEIDEHYYLISKKYQICVLPYTIDSKGLLDKIGVIKDYNFIYEEYDYTLVHGYISQDDGTDLVAANRILYEVIGTNITNADNWMYLGSLYNSLTSDSAINLYAVDVTNVKINESEEIEESKDKVKFNFLDSSRVIATDDSMFLASFLRLFNYFYVQSLTQK